MTADVLATSLVSGSIGAVLAVLVQSWINRRLAQLAMKRDVLRRFVGNLYVLTSEDRVPLQPGREPFVAMNEALVVFSKDRVVLDALRVLQAGVGQPGRLADNIVTLVKAMADACGLAVNLNDSFIERPFTPPTLRERQRTSGS